MIIALLALAFAMIVGGLLAAFFGWDIVLIERGWTMVIAGSLTAASGALLLGVTAVVSKLSQIQSEIARLQLSLDEEAAVEAPVGPTGVSMAALSGGLLTGKMFGRGEEKLTEEEQKDLPLFDHGKMPETVEVAKYPDGPTLSQPREPFMPFPPRTSSEVSVPREEEEAAEVKVPDFLLGDRLRESYVKSPTSDVDDDLYLDEPEKTAEENRRDEIRGDILEPVTEPVTAAPEPEAKPVDEAAVPEEPVPVQSTPTQEASDQEEPAQDAMAQEESEPGEPRSATIIGTYNSGDNTYVMFSDGSIEAQTPSGIFHFHSLDELKAFIASGGEGSGTAST